MEFIDEFMIKDMGGECVLEGKFISSAHVSECVRTWVCLLSEESTIS